MREDGAILIVGGAHELYYGIPSPTSTYSLNWKSVACPHTYRAFLVTSRTNLAASFRPIAGSVSEIWRLLCDDARTLELEKLRSKGVATHARVYYAYTLIDFGRGFSI